MSDYPQLFSYIFFSLFGINFVSEARMRVLTFPYSIDPFKSFSRTDHNLIHLRFGYYGCYGCCLCVHFVYLFVILQRIYIPRMLSLLCKSRWNSTLVVDSSFPLPLQNNEIEKRHRKPNSYKWWEKITQKTLITENAWCMSKNNAFDSNNDDIVIASSDTLLLCEV